MGESARYTKVAIALHWAIALLIIGNIAGGLYMVGLDFGDPVKFQIYQLHKSSGLTILVLSIVRIGWRLTHKIPPLPAAMPPWQKQGARLSHAAFYALMLLTPLLGWAYASVAMFNVPTFWFGLFEWPHLPLGPPNAARAERLAGLHEAAAFAIVGLLVLHIAAALKHHFVDKDGVAARMLPFLK